MTLGAHLIEDDTRKTEGRKVFARKAHESVNDGGSAVGHAPGIDNEQNGEVEDGGNLRRRTLPTVVAVIESHHAFHDVHLFMLMAEHLAEMCGGGETRIEVYGFFPTGHLVVLGVNIIGTALERLHMDVLPSERPEQSNGEGRLPASRVGGRNEKILHLFLILLQRYD